MNHLPPPIAPRRPNAAAPRLGRRPAPMLLLLGLLMFSACGPFCAPPDLGPGPDPTPIADGGDGEQFCTNWSGRLSTTCVRAVDCERGFICGKSGDAAPSDVGCCAQLSCDGNDDCGEGFRCDPQAAVCLAIQPCEDDGADGQCGADAYCQWARDGAACSPAPSPARCEVVPGRLVVRSGDPVRTGMLAYDADDTLIPVFDARLIDNPLLTPSGNDIVAQCDSTLCTGTVQYELSGATQCSAEVVVLGQSPSRRVRFFDHDTGQDLTGEVVVKTDIGVTVFSEIDGAFSLPSGLAVSAITIRVAGYTWRTIVNLPDGDVLVPLSPVAQGGSSLTGTLNFDDIDLFGDLRVGVSGTSVHVPLFSLDLLRLFGPHHNVVVNISGTGIEVARAFPSATTLRLGNVNAKEEFLALSEPGRHLAWSLGTVATFSSLESDFLDENVNRTTVQNAMSMFHGATGLHSSIGTREFALSSTPAPMTDGPILDYLEWPAIGITGSPSQIPAVFPRWTLEIDLPGEGRLEGMAHLLVLVGPSSPLYGFIPTGLLEMRPHAVTQIFQAETQTALPGVAEVAYAPPHSGLENAPISAVVMAFSTTGMQLGRPEPDYSFIVPDIADARRIDMGTNWYTTPSTNYDDDNDVFLQPLSAPPGTVPADMTRIAAERDENPWEILIAGAPDEGASLAAWLPEAEGGQITVHQIQSLSVRTEHDNVHPLSAPVLSTLDEHIEAMYAH